MLAKEAADAREHLRRLKFKGSLDTGMNPSDRTIRKNQLRQIASIIERNASTKRIHRGNEVLKKQATINDDDLIREKLPKLRSERDNAGERGRNNKDTSRKNHRSKYVSDSHEESRRHGRRQKVQKRSRSRSPKESDSRNHSRLSRKRSRSVDRYNSRILSRPYSPRLHDHPDTRLTGCQANKSSVQPLNTDSDSDPLDDVIGPHPASQPEVRTRGRGTVSAASGIDSRFSELYDPNTDVQLESDEENHWDQALEAFRDRQKFKEKGIERLRTAGFTEEEIQRLERNGEKRVQDFQWSKPGERREWDRGKNFDSDGTVGFESHYGRLKDR